MPLRKKVQREQKDRPGEERIYMKNKIIPDKTIKWTRPGRMGYGKLFCIHNYKRIEGTNLAECTKCKKRVLSNCLY